MKALILDGCFPGDDVCMLAHEVLRGRLEERGWQVEGHVLHGERIAPCTGCFSCWRRTPGICVIDDDGRNLAASSIRADLLALITPITFGGYSSQLKKALDRLIGNVSPYFSVGARETRRLPRYERYPRLLGLGVVERSSPREEELFRSLVRRNAANLHAPTQAVGITTRKTKIDSFARKVDKLLEQIGVLR